MEKYMLLHNKHYALLLRKKCLKDTIDEIYARGEIIEPHIIISYNRTKKAIAELEEILTTREKTFTDLFPIEMLTKMLTSDYTITYK